jgi:hypothetical protein
MLILNDDHAWTKAGHSYPESWSCLSYFWSCLFTWLPSFSNCSFLRGMCISSKKLTHGMWASGMDARGPMIIPLFVTTRTLIPRVCSHRLRVFLIGQCTSAMVVLEHMIWHPKIIDLVGMSPRELCLPVRLEHPRDRALASHLTTPVHYGLSN